MRQKVAVLAAAGLADSSVLTVSCAARALIRFRVACVSGADAGVRAVAVGRPCAEIMVERLAGFKGRFIGSSCGAQAADSAGLVVDRLFCAGRGRFQVLFCCCFSREAVFLENSLNGHIAGRHNKAVFRDGNVAAENFPLLEVIAPIGCCGQGEPCSCCCTQTIRRGRAAASGRNGNVILPCVEVQFLVGFVHHLCGRVVRGEVFGVILVIGMGKRHGIVDILGGHADGRAEVHGSRNGQHLAGGQIDVVCRTGDGVFSHGGRTAELQLAGIAGVYINSAAAVAGRVVLDRTAGEIADRIGAENVDAAAAARCGISADDAAGHIQNRRFTVQIDRAAVHRRVPGDFAAGEVKRGCAVHMHRAALAGSLITADLAAGIVAVTPL